MADIFISYAHEDRARIQLIAQAFEVEGFAVWWDRNLVGGDDYALVIEAALEDAACVIVAWSVESRKSSFVRDEASLGNELGILVPVFLDQIRLPLGFGTLHTENLSRWQGDRTAESWQRVILQVNALKQDVEKAAIGTIEQPVSIDTSSPISKLGMNKTDYLGSSIILISLVLSGVSWFLGSVENLGIMGLTLTIAIVAFVLFRQADKDLRPHMKALAHRWLMPEKGKAQVNTSEAFLRLFESVFGKKHWSWFCFWRSALASTIGLGLMFSLFVCFNPEGALRQDEYFRWRFVVAVTFIGIVINILGDYFSLWETRLLLFQTTKRPALLPVFIALDV